MTRKEAVAIVHKAVAYTGTFDRFTLDQRATMADRLSNALELARHDLLSLDLAVADDVLDELLNGGLSSEERARIAYEDEQLDRLYGGNS